MDRQFKEFHRRSIRLKGYDYRKAGAYFVTLAAYQHQDLFGLRIGEQIELNEAGQMATFFWQELAGHFPVTLDAWMLMPDHLHAILFLEGSDEDGCLGLSQQNGTLSGSLGAIMQNYKSVTTRKINRLRRTPGLPVWPRNYYEHVIRSYGELENIHRYIMENPLRHLLRETEDYDGWNLECNL